jgi:hypothetical protein
MKVKGHPPGAFIVNRSSVVTHIVIVTKVSSRCIAEKMGCPGLIIKVMKGPHEAFFAKRTGVVMLHCTAWLYMALQFHQAIHKQQLMVTFRVRVSENEQEQARTM